MGTIYRNGVPFIGGGGGGTSTDVELTQAEYDALPASKLTDDVNYFITDGNPTVPNVFDAEGVMYGNTSSGLTATDVQAAVDENASAISALQSGLTVQNLTASYVITINGGSIAAKRMGKLLFVTGYFRPVNDLPSHTLIANINDITLPDELFLTSANARNVTTRLIIRRSGKLECEYLVPGGVYVSFTFVGLCN